MIPELSMKVLVTAATLAAAGWGGHEYMTEKYAGRDDVKVAMLQSQFVLDLQIELIVKKIARLESLPSLTPTEIEELRYLRGQLAIMRRVRAGR